MSKAARRASRERLKQERLRQQQREKRNRLLAILGAAVVVVALIVGGGYLYMTTAGKQAEGYTGALAPQTRQDDGSVVMAKEGAKAPVVEVYADYQCPACMQFEATNSDTLKKLAADGDAIVHLRPVSIFAKQAAPLNANSLRAGAAARAAADYGKFVEYNDILFENQPAEGSEGFPADDLKAWGEEAGIKDPGFAKRVDAESKVVDTYTDLYGKAVAKAGEEQVAAMTPAKIIAAGGGSAADFDGTYVQEVFDATDGVNARYGPDSGDNAFTGTPAVYINGALQGQDVFRVDALTEAVKSAKPGEVDTKPAEPQPSGSPSASPSESPVEK
ncbi:thioredoxin-like protein [Murinocardiopsis flavida]|uniref:Thioredoxin-like protein n=1 Tax=Murinocardiopsis flavida TaxID=645275 RepID=A0A2P8CNJ0_9ACTN|nr:thioredoxin domain-containing protein [Murinocardiopsis flavida]PSK86548.1 thioredoxin-like protein [Murinocardiopsis flavida]